MKKNKINEMRAEVISLEGSTESERLEIRNLLEYSGERLNGRIICTLCEKKLDTTNIVFRLETEFRLNAWGGYFNSTVPPTINAKAFLEKYGEI